MKVVVIILTISAILLTLTGRSNTLILPEFWDENLYSVRVPHRSSVGTLLLSFTHVDIQKPCQPCQYQAYGALYLKKEIKPSPKSDERKWLFVFSLSLIKGVRPPKIAWATLRY